MDIRRETQVVPEEQVVVEERVGPGHSWSIAQIVAVIIGICFVILGIAGLARTGLPVDHIMTPQREVLGFLHTPLLGAIEIVFGALLILAGVAAGSARSMMAFLGVVATIFGLLVLVDVAPDRLHRWLGVGDPYGWLALIAGVVLLVAAFFSPDVAGERRTRSARRERVTY